MITKLLNEVNGLIATELSRANEQHPMFHSDHEAWAVTREEYMETEDALKQLEYELRYTDYMTRHDDTDGILERVNKLRSCALHVACEAIQTAAMAEKWIDSARERGGKDVGLL